MAMESAQERWERSWAYVEEDRKARAWDSMPDERRNRLFVPHEDIRDDLFAQNFEETY